MKAFRIALLSSLLTGCVINTGPFTIGSNNQANLSANGQVNVGKADVSLGDTTSSTGTPSAVPTATPSPTTVPSPMATLAPSPSPTPTPAATNTPTPAPTPTPALRPSAVTTLAGNGQAGMVDGVGTAAEFNAPSGLTLDAAGNVYVVDAGDIAVREISPAGIVSSFASGNGLNDPRAIASAPNATFFVIEGSGDRLLKVTPSSLSIIAGTGNAGRLDGPGVQASFNGATGIARDAQGSLYVADTGNNVIRKVDAAGNVTTLAGSGQAGYSNGAGPAAQFNAPGGIALDAQGNLYVADTGNQVIRKITPDGAVSTLAGSGVKGETNGTGTAAAFDAPAAIAVDAAGNLVVADRGGNTVRRVTPTGAVTTLAGDGSAGHVDGALTLAEFNGPSGLAIDASGTVYVADPGNNCVREITP